MNIIRGVLWEIAKGVLWLLDGFFSILDNIWRYQFFNNEYVNKIFNGALIVACSWLILKVIIELIMNHIIKNEGKGSPISIYRGVVLAIVTMFLIPSLFNFGHDFSTALTNSVISVSGMSEGSNAESTISRTLVRSMIYKDKMYESDIENLVENWKTIDINKSEGGFVGIGDEYVYSINSFMLIVLSVISVFLLFFVAIQMAKRVMEIALYKIIGPFCCTSMTNSSKAFETWTKSTMGLFLITVVQFVSLGLLMNMFGSAITDNGLLVGIFLMIGALLFIISTPTIVSSLLGQQSGLMSAFGDMQSMMALGHGVNAGINVAKSGLAGAVSIAPKTAGHVSGVMDQFNNYKTAGSSKMGALGKTAFSEVSKPFMNAYQKATNSLSNNYSDIKAKSANPFGVDKSNPYKNPNSIQFNPIRNQYKNMSDDANNNGGMT